MRFVLPIVVFISGSVVMILELAASRIIAPYLGTSVIIWTSLIGVILAALSFGYFMGGRIADKYPSPATLALILGGAGASIAVSSYFQWILQIFALLSNLQMAAMLSLFLLFGPTTILLGMISPLAVKLSLTDVMKSGRTVGNLYAISNTGSIIGTFLGGFILISFFGSSRILSLLSLTLITLSVIVVLTWRLQLKHSLYIIGALVSIGGFFAPNGLALSYYDTLVADVDTQYSRTWIYDREWESGRTVRTMTNDVGGSQSAQYLDNASELVFAYTRMYDDLSLALHPDAKHALMIGGSAYTYPRHFVASSQDRTMTVIEIDPMITELAQKYFGLTEDPNLTIIHEDGRIFLNKNNQKFDLIFVDAFSSQLSIPFHLTTREAVSRISEGLTDEGLVLVNIISALEGSRSGFLSAAYATYASAFPYVSLYRIQDRGSEERQNIILVASKSPLMHNNTHPDSRSISTAELKFTPTPLHVLTDDFAPVERYTALLQF